MVVGILGGIGAGKSLVARLLAEAGATVIDADAHAHEALQHPDCREAVRACWGDAVFDSSGNVDRKALAARVFSRPSELRRLEMLLHPRVLSRIEAEVAQHRDHERPGAWLVLDVPLLLEGPLEGLCDRLVYVHAPLETRIARVASRGWDAAELSRREAFQASANAKALAAHHRVDNSAGIEETRRQVEALVAEWRAGAPRPAPGAEERPGRAAAGGALASLSDGSTSEER